MTDHPDKLEHLTGNIVLEHVTATDADGVDVVKDISLTFPQGGLIAIAAPNEEDRRVMAELLTRELLPVSGKITIGGRNLNEIHQAVIGTRIGWADSAPYLLAGTIGYNMLLSLSSFPNGDETQGDDLEKTRLEAQKSGNAVDLIEDRWRTERVEDLEDMASVHSWWLKVIEATGTEREVLHRSLSLHSNVQETPRLCAALIEIREEVAEALGDGLLSGTVEHFRRDRYCIAVPLLQNILFAAPSAPLTQRELARHPDSLPCLMRRICWRIFWNWQDGSWTRCLLPLAAMAPTCRVVWQSALALLVR